MKTHIIQKHMWELKLTSYIQIVFQLLIESRQFYKSVKFELKYYFFPHERYFFVFYVLCVSACRDTGIFHNSTEKKTTIVKDKLTNILKDSVKIFKSGPSHSEI